MPKRHPQTNLKQKGEWGPASIFIKLLQVIDSIVKPGVEKVDVYGSVSMVLTHNWSSINGSLK